MARVKFAISEYDFAETVYKLVQGGFLNAVSIGGIVKEWDADYTIIKKMEMVELSFVPVGAHPDALVTAKSIGLSVEQVRKQYDEFLLKSLKAKVGEVSPKDLGAYREMFKTLYDLFEATHDNSSQSPNETIERIVIKVQA